jgi:hypothetical protein
MNWLRTTSIAAVVIATILMIFPTDVLAQRRGGSFGGSRRSYSAPRSSPRGGGSFGGSRRSPSTSPYSSRGTTRPSTSQPTSTRTNAFGGSRLNSSREYTSRYGVPRKTETRAIPGANGTTNYTVNRYGGMGDGFMMGYLMGSIPWYYSMPFHPAFYYSRPYTVTNPDGTVGAYPGTFSWGTLFFVLLLVGGGGYILYVWLRNKRQRRQLGGVDMSRSSFG